MEQLISQFRPITLEEMSGVKLMNRIDTKFICTLPNLRQLLGMAMDDYRMQEINGERNMLYETTYFDTPAFGMFTAHQHGHANRQKLRFRTYVSSALQFMEIKTKNNHGRTKKKRIAMEQFDALHPQHDIQFHRQDENFINYDEFLRATLKYDPENLTEQLENRFDRITLVNKARTERLTIDTNLRFNNIATGQKRDMGDIVIIELKRDGNQPSPILGKLCDLHIHPHGFSKYCIGSALTNDSLRRNRIKPRLRSIQKILSHQ